MVVMSWLVDRFVEDPRPCSYLPDQAASLEVRLGGDVSAAELGALLARGWRRFGPTYFRPACTACQACVPTRIPVAAFRPSRSQRRASRQAARLTRVVGPPIVDRERLDLYRRWHRNREARRGWEAMPLDAERYAEDFAFPHPAIREVAFRDPADADRLVGLGLVDEVPGALSAIYFFWDPERAPSSLGTAHVVLMIEDAAARALSWVYLGYRVDECPSLAYKGRFQPQESLAGRPSDDDWPDWRSR
jgi:arginyl-tRNA--protein-N-Asp/Glu arginylyltransferase